MNQKPPKPLISLKIRTESLTAQTNTSSTSTSVIRTSQKKKPKKEKRNQSPYPSLRLRPQSVQGLLSSHPKLDEGPLARRNTSGKSQSIHTIIQVPQPIPKKTAQSIATAKKRTEKISMWRLAKLADNYNRSTAEQAAALMAELSLTSKETQRCQEIMRGIRTGHRQLSAKIRRNLPLDAGKTKRMAFLNWLETAIQRVESRSSDELTE